MKKQYNKPQLRYEDFRLMHAIATSCVVEAQHADKYHCAWFNEDIGLSIHDTLLVSACEIDEIAYGVPQDMVFPS